MVEIKEFLNPKSTLTPGIAGSLAMVAANSMWIGFGLPQAWTALAVSVLFALLLAAGAAAPIWQRAIYVVLNALVIFSVGLGTNGLGAGAAAAGPEPRGAIERFADIRGAEAQPRAPAPAADELKRLQEELKRKDDELRRLEEALRKSELDKGPPTQKPAQDAGQRKFFERWKF